MDHGGERKVKGKMLGNVGATASGPRRGRGGGRARGWNRKNDKEFGCIVRHSFRDVMQSYVHLNLLCCIMLMPNFLNFLSDFDHV